MLTKGVNGVWLNVKVIVRVSCSDVIFTRSSVVKSNVRQFGPGQVQLLQSAIRQHKFIQELQSDVNVHKKRVKTSYFLRNMSTSFKVEKQIQHKGL